MKIVAAGHGNGAGRAWADVHERLAEQDAKDRAWLDASIQQWKAARKAQAARVAAKKKPPSQL